ncbi:hypothetical protein AMAG_07431 [Allomyces macrogynus ATCC 38327]|uniref:Mitochondrial import inner membrane translocase subunit TIM50 n=1 Tax=Allomyces macrogynus (strain ATCC 38327) TaxID=578462 RepID=A0A0L0SI92_ALLM3|nr:hypothetical protein AMAG_07431 [Allomyces macrogynus ATCC 38327]|eukprot:KNE62187.1 hypothetical protein AMAG_07431 [Allomyces macrogynus ATCC 38327]
MPTPGPSSSAMPTPAAAAAATASTALAATLTTPRYLVILDLNGCLLARPSREEQKSARESPFELPPRLATVKKKPVYVRPHASEFAKFALCMPNVDVAVWTSAMPDNAARLAELALGKPVLDQLLFLWGRDMCTLDATGDSPWATVKDLRKVYAAYPHYSPSTTLIVEDSLFKCRLNPDNALLVPSWDLAGTHVPPLDDHTLLDLGAYLRLLSRACPTDVRAWIKAQPLTVAQPDRLIINPVWKFAKSEDGGVDGLAGMVADMSLSSSWIDLALDEPKLDGDDEDAKIAIEKKRVEVEEKGKSAAEKKPAGEVPAADKTAGAPSASR